MARLNTDLTELQWALETAAARHSGRRDARASPPREASYQRMQDRENLDEFRGIMADYKTPDPQYRRSRSPRRSTSRTSSPP